MPLRFFNMCFSNGFCGGMYLPEKDSFRQWFWNCQKSGLGHFRQHYRSRRLSKYTGIIR